MEEKHLFYLYFFACKKLNVVYVTSKKHVQNIVQPKAYRKKEVHVSSSGYFKLESMGGLCSQKRQKLAFLRKPYIELKGSSSLY